MARFQDEIVRPAPSSPSRASPSNDAEDVTDFSTRRITTASCIATRRSVPTTRSPQREGDRVFRVFG